MQKPRKIPQRQCLGCREMKNKKDLIRVVRSPEGEISLAMERLRQGRTCFVIAHRLATVRRADRILVLDQGGVAEAGTHEELLKTNQVYQEIYHSQQEGVGE